MPTQYWGPWLAKIRRGAQRAKFAEKVHKPPLGVNVIDFELKGFNASIWIPRTPKSHDALIEVFKFIRCVKKQVAFIYLF